MIVLSSFVFSIVMVMLGYAIWKWRVKPGDESDGEPIHGNTRLEIAWTVIPTVIVLFGAGYSWVVLDDIEAKDARRMKLDVTAQQFEWNFAYPEQGVMSHGELHVPVDQQLEISCARSTCSTPSGCPSGGSSATGPGRAGIRIDDDFVVTPDKDGQLSADLHRALRHRPRDDAGAGGGRERGRLPAWVVEQDADSASRATAAAETSRRSRPEVTATAVEIMVAMNGGGR